MSILVSIKNGLTPIHKEGYRFIAIAATAGIGLAFIWPPLGWVMAIFTFWVCYFFRDPIRTTPVEKGLIISPADGAISMITEVIPPPELDLAPEPMIRISVFMSVFNCHVNRLPTAARIKRIVYKPGRFVNASLDKASEHNERNCLTLDTDFGPIGLVQIAGLIARRIVHWVAEEEELVAGQRFGLIRFGSRLDVYIPVTCTVLVSKGQTAIAGETILADLRESVVSRTYRTT